MLDWPPPHEPLTGATVRLEPITDAHVPALVAAARDPEIFHWIDRSLGHDDDTFRRYLELRREHMDAGREWCFVTIEQATGEVIGATCYLAVRPEHAGLEIGATWLVRRAWRTGANRDAKLLQLTQCFETLGCQRVELKTDARNARSRAAIEGIGAQFEGIFRKHMLPVGIGVRDSAYYSVIDDEWPAVRDRLTRRGPAAGSG